MNSQMDSPWDINHGQWQPLGHLDPEEFALMPQENELSPANVTTPYELHEQCRFALGINGNKEVLSKPHNYPVTSSSVAETYGSNDGVYNPYNPLASKEYVAQEVAAGRMKPEGAGQQTLGLTGHLQQRPARSNLRYSNIHHLQGMGIAARAVTGRRMADPELDLSHVAARIGLESVSEQDIDHLLLSTFDEDAPCDVRMNRASISLNDHDDCETESELDYEDQSVPLGLDSPNTAEMSTLMDFRNPGASAHRASRTQDFNVATQCSGSSSAQLGSRAVNVYGTPRHGLDVFQARDLISDDDANIFSGDFGSGLAAFAGVESGNFKKAGRGTKIPDAQSVTVKSIILPAPHEPVRERARRSFVSTPFLRSPDGTPDRKRRRTDRPSEIAVPSSPLWSPSKHLSRPRVSVRRASTSTPESAGPSSQYGEAPSLVARAMPRTRNVRAGSSRVELPQYLPESIGLNVDRQLSPPTTTNTPASSPLLDRQILRSQHLVFFSELIPSSFDRRKRRRTLSIFRSQAPYVPICVTMDLRGLRMHCILSNYHQFYTNPFSPYYLSTTPQGMPLRPSGRGWPVLPLEIFHKIASHLPAADIKSMRLVNHVFERGVSNLVFQSVVVPFRPEVYGMMIQDTNLCGVPDAKGKGKQKEEPFRPDEIDGTVHDGMKVFQAWGPHVKKFAMAFEISPDQLARPPVKTKFVESSTWWGPYAWPHLDYLRFDYCANLEKKADEYRCMSSALSNLQGVRELGLSLVSGLGWLSGPDISDHARLYQQKAPVFGTRAADLEQQHLEYLTMWGDIARPFMQMGYLSTEDFVEICLRRSNLTNPHRRRPFVYRGVHHFPQQDESPFDIREYTSYNPKSPFKSDLIVPFNLTRAQKEWLLESEWAQRAFLSSYCMALTDNSHTFRDVHSLNIAQISSNHLSALEREDFWAALPNMNSLTLIVVADFRKIYKKDSGEVGAADVQPSEAATRFYTLLENFVAKVKGIKSMTLGYSGGGEHQAGIYGRNKMVLPAPLVDYSDPEAFEQTHDRVLQLPHVQKLTFKNCWMAPPILKTYISLANKTGGSLTSLTLDSISLSAHSGVANPDELDPLEDDVSRFPTPPGRRLSGNYDAHSFFSQRPDGSDPSPGSKRDLWVYTARRIGSWPNVIDAITPGPTLDLVRYAFHYRKEPPKMRKPGTLKVINLISCGYVRLPEMVDLQQDHLPKACFKVPGFLEDHVCNLMAVMMDCWSDRLLGQIVPGLPDLDVKTFKTGFPMRIGWGNDARKYDNLEDGQPIGGSGRFTGRVDAL